MHDYVRRDIFSATFRLYQSNDFIEGFEDLGNGQRVPKFAKYALVFMVRGSQKVRNCGLKIIATISDQGTNNCVTVNLLIKTQWNLISRTVSNPGVWDMK